MSSVTVAAGTLNTNLSTTVGPTGLGGITAGQPALGSEFSGLNTSMQNLQALAGVLAAAGWVASDDLATGCVTSAKIADGSIVTADLADGAVTSAKIADGAISNVDVASSAAIATSKIASGTLTSGTILVTDNITTPTFGLKRSDGAYYLSGDSGGWAFGGSSGPTSGSIKAGILSSNGANMSYGSTNGWSFANSTGGDARVYAGRYTGTGVYANANTGRTMVVDSTGDFGYGTSSEKYKTNITPYSVDLRKVLALDPVTFNWKKDVDAGVVPQFKSAGMIAERLDEAGLHEFVYYGDAGEVDGIDYMAFSAVLLSVCKQQQSMIDDLVKRVEVLEAK